MNGFEKHGLAHSSPSALNMWATAPCAWVAKYLYGAQFRFGVAPMIGILVEEVVKRVLLGESFEAALSDAEKQFNKSTALGVSEKDRQRISNIKDMAELAIEVLKPYGVPEFRHTIKGAEQQRIELLCNGDGWQLPVIGFLDFVYPEHGLIIDLKSTLRCPSEMSVAHARQAAIYSKAKGNMECKMLYVTPKKTSLLGVEDVPAVLSEVKYILNRQEKMLRLDKEEIKEIIPIAMDSFYWTGDLDVRKSIYGI
jgi:hypothetical protein